MKRSWIFHYYYAWNNLTFRATYYSHEERKSIKSIASNSRAKYS